MTITVLSIVFTDLRIVVGVVFWAEFVMVVAVLGGNLSINLRELCGAYLGLLIAFAALALLFILFLFLILLTFFAAL